MCGMPANWLPDFEGRVIRLSAERRQHIFEHPEMAGLENSIAETLDSPDTVVESLSDPRARLYYRYYYGTAVGDKFLCVVVKLTDIDGFVITAYLTDRLKKGKQTWPRKP